MKTLRIYSKEPIIYQCLKYYNIDIEEQIDNQNISFNNLYFMCCKVVCGKNVCVTFVCVTFVCVTFVWAPVSQWSVPGSNLENHWFVPGSNLTTFVKF